VKALVAIRMRVVPVGDNQRNVTSINNVDLPVSIMPAVLARIVVDVP
jgi:hypothetical protein